MTAKQEYISAERRKTLERVVNDLNFVLDGAEIESPHPLIVTVLVTNRAARMNLQGILNNIQRGKL